MSSPHHIYLFGMERSGTTLLSMMLGAHPNIAVPLATTGMWYEIYELFKTRFSQASTPQDLNDLVDYVLAHDRVRIWNVELDRDRILNSCECRSFGSVVAATHMEYARRVGKQNWANMDIATLDKMHIAHNWAPQARFVHIVRDGRDVALSHQTMPYGSGNILECAWAWDRRLSNNFNMGSILGPDQYFALRYEDLIINPAETLAKLCRFLDITYSEEMLNYGRTVDSRVPKDKMWLWPILKEPPQKDRVYRWKTEMSDTQRVVFERNAADMLRKMNYEVPAEIPSSLQAIALETLYLLDRGGRWKRISRKLGFGRSSKLERQAKGNTG